MGRQLEFWSEDSAVSDTETQLITALETVSVEVTIEREQSETKATLHQLFTNPEREIGFDAQPHYEWPKPLHDRNTITVDRIRNDIDGPAHRFVIKRHDYVEVFFNKDKVDYGHVVGISHSRNEVRVSFGEGEPGIWFDAGCIYPAIEPQAGKRTPKLQESSGLDADSPINQAVARVIEKQTQYTSIKIVSVVRVGSLEGRPKINSTVDAVAYFKKYWIDNPGNDQENFVIAVLDTKHVPLGIYKITTGTLDASLVHPREVFKPAVIEGASAIVLSHNHPSGDPTPSREDHAVTKRLTEAGQLLGITVLDHIIFGDGTHNTISIREC